MTIYLSEIYNTNCFSIIVRSGCNLNTEQITCNSLVLIEHAIQIAACDAATHDAQKRKDCNTGFKAFEAALKGSCGIALAQICDDDNCPQNHSKSSCKRRAKADF